MRDAAFYYDLGFEHGYALLAQSYPDNASYAEGYADGTQFRHNVHNLVPSIYRNSNGTKSVLFTYCLPRER